jgi:hypothetical protein
MILKDLSLRILNRKLFKTVRVGTSSDREKLLTAATSSLEATGYDPRYYLHEISAADVHAGDSRQSMLVQLDNGDVITLSEADPLIKSMASESKLARRSWLALPAEAKKLLTTHR